MEKYNYTTSIKKYIELSNGRSIAVFGNDLLSIEIAYTIKELNYNFVGLISEGGVKTLDKDNITIFSLSSFMKKNNINNIFVIAAQLTDHKYLYESLISLGLEFNKDFVVMGIGGYTDLLNRIDPLLGLNRVNGEIPGFKIYGSKNKKNKKIVILGNSTSDATTNAYESWPEKLFKKADKDMGDITLYNGAITGYSTTQELLKFQRDVLPLEPDICISFSGYNDVCGNSTLEKYPFVHKYQNKFFDFLKKNEKLCPDSMFVRNVTEITYGMECIKKDYEVWINNMRSIYALCNEFNIKFRAYLQPMLNYRCGEQSQKTKKLINEYLSKTNVSNLDTNVICFCDGARKELKKYDYIIDLTGLFEKDYDTYYDVCHYTDYGNNIISETIYDEIKEIFHENN